MDLEYKKYSRNLAIEWIAHEVDRNDWITLAVVYSTVPSKPNSTGKPYPLQIALASPDKELILQTLIRPPCSWKRDRVEEALLARMQTTAEELFSASPWENVLPLITKATMHKTIICWDQQVTEELLTIHARGKNKGVTLPANRRYLDLRHYYKDFALVPGPDCPDDWRPQSIPLSSAEEMASALSSMVKEVALAKQYELEKRPTEYRVEIDLTSSNYSTHLSSDASTAARDYLRKEKSSAPAGIPAGLVLLVIVAILLFCLAIACRRT